MGADELDARSRQLQSYVAWDDADAARIQAVASVLDPCLATLIDDFYAEIERHPAARKTITGGEHQIGRLKRSLIQWLRELLNGPYDRDYVLRRWRVGWRHVEIGLDQIYTNVALCRLRTGLVGALGQTWSGDQQGLVATIQSLNKLLDLDLATIEDAYQAEYLARSQRNERLAAIGQVAGGVAHELRNPLNVVKTSVYYLLHARSPTSEKVLEHLHRIEQHVTLADEVITALSNFAKMPIPSLVPFSASECLNEVLHTEHLPANIELDISISPVLPAALGDSGQIRIVFANLIRNARDAMPNGGRLTITGREIDGQIEIAFTDNGVGIPAEKLGHIMEPLYSTKARGLGLGLALAKAILDRHSGSLRAASEQGKGSTFTVRLAANRKDTTSES